MLLYDVPSRAPCALGDLTIARLAEVPGIIGLKDASGEPNRVPRLRALVGTEFRLLSGDDTIALGFIAQGGDGCISVASNVAPGLCRDMFLTLRQGQITRAQRLAQPVSQLTAALFRETNPAPLKFALSLLGLMGPKVRLPLVEVTDHTEKELSGVLGRLCNDYAGSMIAKVANSHSANRLAS
jgi:4-hydroxy-tetrahydrodipicolinate synthase